MIYSLSWSGFEGKEEGKVSRPDSIALLERGSDQEEVDISPEEAQMVTNIGLSWSY